MANLSYISSATKLHRYFWVVNVFKLWILYRIVEDISFQIWISQKIRCNFNSPRSTIRSVFAFFKTSFCCGTYLLLRYLCSNRTNFLFPGKQGYSSKTGDLIGLQLVLDSRVVKNTWKKVPMFQETNSFLNCNIIKQGKKWKWGLGFAFQKTII